MKNRNSELLRLVKVRIDDILSELDAAQIEAQRNADVPPELYESVSQEVANLRALSAVIAFLLSNEAGQ